MRIISGKFKGQHIRFLKNVITRPLKDSVKENIFNILTHSNYINVDIKKGYVLDLFSGVGSFGLECISRGAKKVFFVDKNNEAQIILKENIIKFSSFDHTEIVNDSVEQAIKKIKKVKFDIIFLDPPFSDTKILTYLEKIKINKICKEKHIIIMHRERKTQDKIDEVLDILNVKGYGRSKIFFGRLRK